MKELGMQTGEAACKSAGPEIELLMSRYQQADSAAATSLVEQLSPLLPWLYAIAWRVPVDGYRNCRRIGSRESTVEVLPERPAARNGENSLPAFEDLIASLPESQREVVTMLKVHDSSLEEVARATSSTVGAAKQKAHRAYQRLRSLLEHSNFAPPVRKGVAK